MSHQSDLISTDIDAYLEQYEQKELLRFLTCGSVDDGKSTLIGRLLHDSKMIYEDQLAAITSESVKSGTTGSEVDLALLVDGLQAEREQGITIDVAYRFFSTSHRKFIIADTPGHEQYTRNMATGASNSDLAIILIDARNGVQTQTRRHTIISSLLGIKHIIVAINKMDLMNFDEEVYNHIKRDYLDFISRLDRVDLHFIPISALRGDNVVHSSENTLWYDGLPLMEILETVEIAKDRNLSDFRFPVQYVNRPDLNFRGYCGTVAGGIVRQGDTIKVLPSGKTSKVKSIVTFDGKIEEAYPPLSVTLTLKDEIDISRGDMITHADKNPLIGNKIDTRIVWMTEDAMKPGKEYFFKFGCKTNTGSISRIYHRIDVNSLEQSINDELHLNEIGHCEVTLTTPAVFDPYKLCKGTGIFIIIDRLSNVTVGAGMIIGLSEKDEFIPVSQEERIARYGKQPLTLCLTGSNRLEKAHKLERRLFDMGHICVVLNEDELSLDIDTLSTQFMQAGLICICCTEQPLPDTIVFDSNSASIADILTAIH